MSHSLPIPIPIPNSLDFQTFARWRPLTGTEIQESTGTSRANEEIKRDVTLENEEKKLYSITLWPPSGTRMVAAAAAAAAAATDVPDARVAMQDQHQLGRYRRVPQARPWRSQASFKNVFETDASNPAVFEGVVAEAVPKVLRGSICSFFAYGHTGSGKTHTIIGWDGDGEDGNVSGNDTGKDVEGEMKGMADLGLFPIAARRLFEMLEGVEDVTDALTLKDADGRATDSGRLGVAFSLFELRKNVAVDLLNDKTKCHIREGADGKTHVRGETEILDDGKVRVKPIMKQACWTYEELNARFRESIRGRSVGSSSVHDQSSRTHAVLELEIVSQGLVRAREALYERQAELVPVGKRATDVYLEETMKSLIKGDDGVWRTNPDRPVDQPIIDAAEAEKAECELRVAAAEEEMAKLLSADASLGGKMIFVDLAGSEYHDGKGTPSDANQPVQKTPQEKREGRQINTDLFALKEVIRAISSKQTRVPFRTSPLTMVLREHFLGSKGGTSSMIVTVSPAVKQYTATLNSLKYGSLVGAACA